MSKKIHKPPVAVMLRVEEIEDIIEALEEKYGEETELSADLKLLLKGKL